MWPGLGEISTFFQREGKVLASQNVLGNLRELRLAIKYTHTHNSNNLASKSNIIQCNS